MTIQLPNLLSAFRLLCFPLLHVLAWNGARTAFLLLFAAGLLSDVLDGYFARRFGQQSEAGARLDQWGDFALWLALPLSAWWLWGDIMRRELTYVVVALVAMVLPTLVAFARYGEVPGYHTWSVKVGAILMGIAVPLLLLFDVPWPFRLAALFQLICFVDEIGITLMLPDCHHDVPSVFHAARLRHRE